KLENAGAEPGIDGWLTPGPWAEMVAVQRGPGKESLLKTGGPLARSQIGFAVWSDRLQVLSGFCKGPVTWKCVGEAAGKVRWDAIGGQTAWGPVKIGIPDPANVATGLAAVAAATAGYFGTTDLSLTNLDDP